MGISGGANHPHTDDTDVARLMRVVLRCDGVAQLVVRGGHEVIRVCVLCDALWCGGGSVNHDGMRVAAFFARGAGP